MPLPSVNLWVAGYEVDALWAEQRLIVELDGYVHHADRTAFEIDRARDAALMVAGYRVVRVTWQRLMYHEADLAATLRALLSSPR